MKTKPATKPAAKTAAKTPAPAKTAAKAAAKTAAKAAAPAPAEKFKVIAKPVKTLFAITPTSRPTAGKLLAAHTIAALNVLGMLTAPKTPASYRTLQTLIGPSAIGHHCSQGNLDRNGESISLTGQGHAHFMSKLDEGKADPAAVSGFVKLLTQGDASGTNIPDSQLFQVA